MGKQEVLSMAIEKAIEGGWPAEGVGGAEDWQELPQTMKDMVLHTLLTEGEGNGYWLFIYDHSFAQALWSDKKHVQRWYGDAGFGVCESDCDVDDPVSNVDYCWQAHLRQVVIADDPIQYLADHLDKESV